VHSQNGLIIMGKKASARGGLAYPLSFGPQSLPSTVAGAVDPPRANAPKQQQQQQTKAEALSIINAAFARDLAQFVAENPDADLSSCMCDYMDAGVADREAAAYARPIDGQGDWWANERNDGPLPPAEAGAAGGGAWAPQPTVYEPGVHDLIKKIAETDLSSCRYINIKVRSQEGSEIHFKIKTTTTMQNLMDAYCKQRGVNSASVLFLLDGDPINVTETPDTLEMEDGDVIDVHQQQTGDIARFGHDTAAPGSVYLNTPSECHHLSH